MIRSTRGGDTPDVDLARQRDSLRRRTIRVWVVAAAGGLTACSSNPSAVWTSIEPVALEAPFPTEVVQDKVPISYPVTVRVGHIYLDDPWYHDLFSHQHGDEVKTTQTVAADGRTLLTIRIGPSGAPSGTELTFAFRERTDADPEVTVTGRWRMDARRPGEPHEGELVGIEAEMQVSRAQWGKGWPMKCVFVATADMRLGPVILAGGFVVDAK